MSLTPLLDQLDDLGAAGVRLLAACEAVVDQARHELQGEVPRGRGRPPADRIHDARRLLSLLEHEPDLSATRAAEKLHVRRQFAHALLRAIRPAPIPDTAFPNSDPEPFPNSDWAA